MGLTYRGQFIEIVSRVNLISDEKLIDNRKVSQFNEPLSLVKSFKTLQLHICFQNGICPVDSNVAKTDHLDLEKKSI